MRSPIYAMLLAAGLGTRLQDLSQERPKPMLPVCNRPLIRWAASLAVHFGIEDLLVNLHHLGDQIRNELPYGTSLGARVSYSPEKQILGTGGGIKAMAALRPRGTCLVLNAKIVTDIDLGRLLAFHREQGALATMMLHPDPEAERWGAIGVDESGRITRLLKLRRPDSGPSQDMMFTGIHVLEPELMDAIPEGPCCVIRTAYTKLFERGAPLAGYVHRGYFWEHSTPQRYLQGNFNLLEGIAKPLACPGPLTGVDASAEIHPGARLVEPLLVGSGARIEAGATVGPRVVLGEGSRVASGAHASECIVWPGAELEGSLHRAIVTPRTTMRLDESSCDLRRH